MSKFIVSSSPHIVSPRSTKNIMLDVIIALIPAMIASTIFFGIRALLVTVVCVLSCVIFEYLSRILMKRDNTISDLSAVVTGILLAFNLPVTIPLWIAVLGCFFSIVIVKQLFGGIGQNFANPAITGRIFLFVSFAVQMTNWVNPFYYIDKTDAVSTATPLVNMTDVQTIDLFLGNVGGCLGETSALALIIGGVYLVIRKVISPIIPLTYISTVFIFSLALGENPLNQIFAGGLMLGAVFMATDYATSPSTNKGKFIFAIGCGVITSAIRLFGNYPEGVSFAILFMNIVSPLIDRATMTKPFGFVKKQKGGM